MNPVSASPAADAALDEPAWTLNTRSGTTLCVPPSLGSLTTYVLLEQEAWFEPEIGWLTRVLEPGMHVLDIGANHGIYALEMARVVGPGGHVWAFEPTRSPRRRFEASVAANGLADRITVVDAGLAECAGSAAFAVQANSELNSRSGHSEMHESVRLLALDEFLQTHAPGRRIDFVKLDAEGDELRVLAGGARFFTSQSPIVMFEFKHGSADNLALVHTWRRLDFDVFRLSSELGVLLPFDPSRDETAFALNLFALRRPEQERLAARGLLALPCELQALGEVAIDAASLPAWCARPALSGLPVDAPAADGVYGTALRAVAAAHLQPGLPGAARVALLIEARERMLAEIEAGTEAAPEAWTLLLHTMHALGQQKAAVDLGARLLAHWPTGIGVERACVPPLREDLERRRSTALGDWLRHCLAEFVAMRSSYSSYFSGPSPHGWAELLGHPDHAPEIERRYLLASMRTEQTTDLGLLTHLTGDDGATCNRHLWRGVLEAMRGTPPAAPCERAEDVLAGLPVIAIGIVDVGASSHGEGTEPYAPLLRAGLARVTAFEPDAQALAELRSQPSLGTDPRHRLLPHWVGNGGDAVFHRTNWHMTGSLLSPQRAWLDRYHQLGGLVQELERHPVRTVRLDDVVEAGAMDMLKIDVQGGELLVFDGAARRLDECLLVWTEVEFAPLYVGQPLFADIDARLRGHGLQFLGFNGLSGRTLAGWPARDAPAPRRQQLLWADALYVPTPQRLAALDADCTARFALLAHHVLGAWDLCHEALQRLDLLQGGNRASRYLYALRSRG
jgi:FkbM family methyltransferase